MPQSLAKNTIHLIFSTKNRHPWLTEAIRHFGRRAPSVVLMVSPFQGSMVSGVHDPQGVALG